MRLGDRTTKHKKNSETETFLKASNVQVVETAIIT